MTDDWAERRIEERLAKIRGTQPRPQPLSEEARAARMPPPPADRVDIIEDRVHIDCGPARPAFAVRAVQSPPHEEITMGKKLKTVPKPSKPLLPGVPSNPKK